jgi:hypothetical protein
MKRIFGLIALAGLAICGLRRGPLLSLDQVKPDPGKILGTWALEVYADGQTIFLTLLLENRDAGLGGKISEQMGMFTDAPVKNVKYEGQNLTFEIAISAPLAGKREKKNVP